MSRSIGNLIETGNDRNRRELARDGSSTIARVVNGRETLYKLASRNYRQEIAPYVRGQDWNEGMIVAQGNKLRHFVNGKLINETVDENPVGARVGILALEVTGSPGTIDFKDLRLRQLGPANPSR